MSREKDYDTNVDRRSSRGYSIVVLITCNILSYNNWLLILVLVDRILLRRFDRFLFSKTKDIAREDDLMARTYGFREDDDQRRKKKIIIRRCDASFRYATPLRVSFISVPSDLIRRVFRILLLPLHRDTSIFLDESRASFVSLFTYLQLFICNTLAFSSWANRGMAPQRRNISSLNITRESQI